MKGTHCCYKSDNLEYERNALFPVLCSSSAQKLVQHGILQNRITVFVKHEELFYDSKVNSGASTKHLAYSCTDRAINN
jgi:hypothetical protein